LARAKSIVTGAERELRGLLEERAHLDARIDLRSGEGVQEDLEEVSALLAAASARQVALSFEVSLLNALVEALEAARSTARDRYLQPVMAELQPLLRLLWTDAELRFDGESLLPMALVRGGQEEEIGVLSGGTQEQIALLVRLAFARLLAKTGRHAPVILDDALVYTDDDRIERMFDALHGQAADLQIIVFSCRQRAFRDLGGTKLIMEDVPA
jgi:DNA repair exonuclease SbcCD ATPase subunit